MAETTKGTTKPTTQGPAAPTKPVTQAVAAARAANGEKSKAKKERVQYQEVFPTAEAAKEAADSRTKGPRRAFKTTYDGKDIFVVANNEGRAGGVAFKQIGGTVEEIGKSPKVKTVGVAGILEALNALPAEEREKVMAQLKALGGS